MDAYQCIVSKRDTRDFTDEPVADDLVRRILNAGRMAGSAKNRQPIRMVVLTDTDDQQAFGRHGDFCDWIHTAPVVVAVAVDRNAGVRTQFDVGRVCQNLMLAANDAGLASCPVTIHRSDDARAQLGLAEDYDVLMAVVLGHGATPQGERRSHPRHALDEIVTWR
ncbi:MAG: nitroreductase family protein [Actinomycetota bacterium]